MVYSSVENLEGRVDTLETATSDVSLPIAASDVLLSDGETLED
jgi:hypothetical protein